MTRRRTRDLFVAGGALLALALAAVVVLAIVAVILWAVFASWKIILGFAIGATVIAAASIGVRRT